MGARADCVLAPVRAVGADVLLFLSVHFLWVLAGRWLKLEPAPGSWLVFSTASRAEQQLHDPKLSVIDARLDAGIQNSSHFARVFRKLEGNAPSQHRADWASSLPRLEKEHVKQSCVSPDGVIRGPILEGPVQRKWNYGDLHSNDEGI